MAVASRLLCRTLRGWSRLTTQPLLPVAPSTRSSHAGGEGRLESSSAKSLTDVGIRRIFSSDHDIFRESVRKFFQEEVVPHHTEWEKAGEVSRELWKEAGKQGLLGINIAEKHGGIGGDLFSSAIVWEEQAYSNCTGPGFSLHSDIVMPYITNYGSEEQIKRFIPEMTTGKCIGAIAMTEPGAGSDLQGIRTNAKRDGSDWILNGSKVFITNGWMSDLVIVVAVTNREARSPAHGISLFLVENGMKGFIKGRKLHKMGLKAQDTAELFFEDVRLPASALLGEENKGFYYLMAELPQERLVISDVAISSCEFMFEETRNYVRQRKAFGKTVAHIQTVQHKLAELKTRICVTRAFVDSCLQLHEAKRLDSATASMAKYWASELQNSVAYDCVQLHGGWGYMWEYPIAKAYVDARVQPIYGGTNEIMKDLIAREIVRDK
ncbi:long-chain specific acyl-CoA dehydrogenase, mitochondrial [Vombatus ursinus]|uniref:Long-chain specific acyl-CoA dehydrogenase, mitochondrial n=1 Tax=Vombatus ursinus TaxID=29139 RepID=A0A4X2JYS3_VOMUR|nr:long-chain specific acyl-CoA dehydrogenase, mitochondrial [Vombatus ursinus]